MLYDIFEKLAMAIEVFPILWSARAARSCEIGQVAHNFL